ncbi:MAG: cytochrome d ubiquinol oxidase subunit II [Chlamydiota bacterium]
MMTLSLAEIWYGVLCLAAIAYVVLDGFDLGVGMLHLFTRKDQERRLMLNAIGPVWDGNEVWLIIVGGALLAGFPPAYATLCSAFYTPLMIFLAGIIFRAVAIEFRSKLPSSRWRSLWDVIFSLGSFTITLVLGVLLGNLIKGIPLDQEGDFFGSFWSFFTPYTLLMGLMAVALCMMHGSIYLNMKIEGEFHKTTRKWSNRTMIFFVITYITATFTTLIAMPHMLDIMKQIPYLYFLGVIAMLSIANIPRMLSKGNDGWAFTSSCFSIALLFLLFGVGMYPVIIRSSVETDLYSITLYNSASSDLTLKVLLTIAGIGLPLVIAYGFWIYRIFKGKVKLDKWSY